MLKTEPHSKTVQTNEQKRILNGVINTICVLFNRSIEALERQN